jgi:hypothetical protein
MHISEQPIIYSLPGPQNYKVTKVNVSSEHVNRNFSAFHYAVKKNSKT